MSRGQGRCYPKTTITVYLAIGVGAIYIVRALVYLRNLCAHQARIWNRELIVKVANKRYLQPFGDSEERAQWRIISILMSLIDGINQNDGYSKEVLGLCRRNEEFYKGLTAPTL